MKDEMNPPSPEVLHRITEEHLPNARYSIRGFNQDRERVYLIAAHPVLRFYNCVECAGEIALAGDRVRMEQPKSHNPNMRRRSLHPDCVSQVVQNMVKQ